MPLSILRDNSRTQGVVRGRHIIASSSTSCIHLSPALNTQVNHIIHFVTLAMVRWHSSSIWKPTFLTKYNTLLSNSLPLSLFINKKKNKYIKTLVYTRASLCTCCKSFHQWFATHVPSTISKFVEFDPSTPYDAITFCTAIIDDIDTPSPVSILTLVVKCHTPYAASEGNPVILSFGIGNNIAMKSIIKIPALKSFVTLVNLHHNTLNCKSIRHIFRLLLTGDLAGPHLMCHTVSRPLIQQPYLS